MTDVSETVNAKLREALAEIRRERHHYCYGETHGTVLAPPSCDCGKKERDALIDAALSFASSGFQASSE